MKTESKLLVPPKLLMLDLVGATIAGFGLAKLFANVDVIPESLRFENYGVVFIVAGFALMLPAMAHIIRTARDRSEAGGH